MPGGVAAIREPWRMAAVWLVAPSGRPRSSVPLADVDPTVRGAVLDLAARGRRRRVTTSMGRLFDAVAALLGGRRRVSYEAQAAIELEALARTVDRRRRAGVHGDGRPSTATDGALVLDPARSSPRWRRERDAGHPAGRWSPPASTRRSAGPRAELAVAWPGARGLDTVALTGGVFQNVRLTEVVEDALVAGRPDRPRPPARSRPTTAASASARPPSPPARAALIRTAASPVVAQRRVRSRGGAAPRPMPQLAPPRRPSSSSSGGRAR